jgi:predicted metal-binding membrane protein
MLLGFVGGVMNLAFMGLATVMMILEKLPDIGRWLTRPLGYGLIGWGLFALVGAFI